MTCELEQLGHYVNGGRIAGGSGRKAPVYNPALGVATTQVALASAAETRAAIAAARAALPEWSETPALRRARVLFRFRDLIDRHSDELAGILSREHGKVLPDARGEVTRGLEIVEFACGIPQLMKGEYSDAIGRGIDSWSLRQPVGVCAGITPFNFPAMVPMWMFPIAIACGNTFVLKPSEKDPGCPLRLAELLTEAGAPAGVLNVVNGDREAVDTLLTDPGVDAVSFVGSTPIAEHVFRTGSEHGKRVQALGGAKNHMVVMPDADPAGAAHALAGAAYGSAGERCMAISVAVAVGDAGDRLIEALEARARRDPRAARHGGWRRHGPAGHARAPRSRAGLRGHRRQGRRETGRGRPRHQVPGHERGFFMGPVLFDQVTESMRIYREEIFGPVLVVVRVPTLDAALGLIERHEYGNGTAIFTRDGGAAREFTRRVAAGMVGINVPIPVPMAFHSFGGWKRSLFGPLHMHGPDGVRFYTRLKTVTARWPEGSKGAEFTMPTMK